MVKPKLQIPHSELKGRLQALMLLRVIFVSLLLGASIFIQIKETQTYFGYIQTSHYLLIAAVYFLTFIYAVFFKYSKKLLWFAYVQLLTDTLFVTAIIYSTGGIESIFSFLYILVIITGSIIVYRRGGMIIASCSSILYGLLLDLHYYGVIHPFGLPEAYTMQHHSAYIFFLILVNITGFYLVAYLSSYLSEQARTSRDELKAKQVDIDKLEILNETIINSITSGLIALDGENTIILFNPAAEQMFGIRASEATGHKIDKALPALKPYLPGLQTVMQKTVKRPPPFVDLPFLKPDGEKIHLRLSVSPLQLSWVEQKGNILVFQDMREIMQIEAEMKKVEGLAMVGELAAGIAHEIRNPMASISGSIQMLRDELKADDVNRRLMDIISREISRLNRLVNNFLLFARPKRANMRAFDLNHLISESLELFKNSQHWTGKMKVLTDFCDSISLESDPEQIKQVLWNLFLNACEAMPDGGAFYVTTHLRSNGSQSCHEQVKISVRDTGNGFDASVLKQVFTPFFTTKEEGSGLGLAIVKRITEGLHGEVYGSNHPHGGAEINIILPISLAR